MIKSAKSINKKFDRDARKEKERLKRTLIDRIENIATSKYFYVSEEDLQFKNSDKLLEKLKCKGYLVEKTLCMECGVGVKYTLISVLPLNELPDYIKKEIKAYNNISRWR